MPTKPPQKGNQTAPNKKGKVKNCTPGKTFPCGGSCFSMGRPCKKEMKQETATKAKNLGGALKKEKPPKSTTSKTPKTETKSKVKKEKITEVSATNASDAPPKKNGDLGTGMPTTPIKNYKDFEKAAIESLNNINYEYNQGNLISISKLRKDLEGRLSNKEFDDYMFDLQANDKIQLITGGKDTPKDEQEGKIVSSFGGDKYYVKLEQESIRKELGSNRKNISKNPIKDIKEFESVVSKLYDDLNKTNNYNNLVPIYQIRRALGDRVTRGEFNEFLFKMQANDKFQLQGGSVEDSARDKIEDSVSSDMDNLRTYMKKL